MPFRTQIQYQQTAFQPPEFITQDKWYQPWTDPVRLKIAGALAIALMTSGMAVEVLTPPLQATAITSSSPVIFQGSFQYQSLATPVPVLETVTIDKWVYPWTDPVRFRQFPTAEQRAFIQGPFLTPESITEDKWHFKWSTPVRQKAGLGTLLQQTLAAPVFTPPPTPPQQTSIAQLVTVGVQYESRLQYQSQTQPAFTPVAETITVDKWIYAWSEPVRFRQLATALQHTRLQGQVFAPETITEDKWHFPWSEPVRQLAGLKTHLQQAFIAPVLDDETQIIQTFESRWHFAWSDPVRVRPPLLTAQQQTLAFQPPSFEILTIDKWGFAWSEPVRQKPGLVAYLQQTLAQTVLNPDTQITQNYESRWHFAWSEPIRIRPQVPAGEQQALIQGPVQTPEFITVDKWIYPWTDPVRQKIGLRASLQQAFIAPVLADEQVIGTIESRWHQPWSEPVRFRAFPAAEQQSYAAPATSVFETVTVDKWIYSWTDPVKQKLGLKTHLQQAFVGTTLEPNTQIIQTYESRWHQPWSDPTRPKISVASQPSFAWSAFVPTAETITVDKWLKPFNEPVRQKLGLAVNLQQTFTAPIVTTPIIIPTLSSPVIFNRVFQYPSYTAPVIPNPIVVPSFSSPVIFSRAFQYPSHTLVLDPNTQITRFFESRWHFPWSEPKRFKAGLGAWLQDTTTPKTPIFPTGIVRLNQWFAPLSQPVRLKIGLGSALQQFFITDAKPTPLGGITLTLSATEVNSDSASFGITVYNAVPVVSGVPTTVVSIQEIQAVRKAAISTEEVPAVNNASVSVEET